MRASILTAFACLAGAVLFSPAPALAADKVALLIGTSEYSGVFGQPNLWETLGNAEHDVSLVDGSLKAIGFETILVKDGKFADIDKAIRAFSELSTGAKIAVIYFAGHGFEYQRKNYLVPADAPSVVTNVEISRRFIDFEDLVARSARAQTNLFFIDACRTAFPILTIAQGGAAGQAAGQINDVDFPEGAKVAILYSTARGRPAWDAAPPPRDYSPFAWEVAQDVALPHVDLGILMPMIRKGVWDRTATLKPPQQPYYYASLDPGSYLNEADKAPTPAAETRLAPAPANLGISARDLMVVDEPLLVASVLRGHSFAEIEALARGGDPIATYLIGYMYEFGIGVPTSLALAREWLEKAATKSPSGQLELAYLLADPSASPAEHQRAVALYAMAAALGFPKAMGHRAEMLMEGRLVPYSQANYDLGLNLLRQAADGGYPYAMYALLLRGDAKDRAIRLDQLRETARGGNADGNQWLCDITMRQGDYASALPDCRTAATAGLAVAQARLATAYHDGLGVAANDDEARHWTRLALSQSWLEAGLRKTLAGYHYVFTIHRP